MNLQRLGKISHRMVFCLLIACVKSAYAEGISDYSSTFGMSYANKKSDHVVNSFDLNPPPAGERIFSESSFSELTRSHYSLLQFIDIHSPSLALDTAAHQSPIDPTEKQPEIIFRKTRESSPEATRIDSHGGQQKERSYPGYVASSSETDTWLMILVGITLIGLQVMRSNKKSEPIYSSLN